MRLKIPGSVIVGPSPVASSTPVDVAAYLTSIGKASRYAVWVPGTHTFPNSDGTGAAVAVNGPIGWIAPTVQVNFDHKWIQATTSQRPSLVMVDGLPGVKGDAVSWKLQLSNTTALDGIAHGWAVSYKPTDDAGYIISHGITTDALQLQSGSSPNFERLRVGGANAVNVPQVSVRKFISGSTYGRVNQVWETKGSPTGVVKLLSATSDGFHTASVIHWIAMLPVLTNAEMAEFLRYMP